MERYFGAFPRVFSCLFCSFIFFNLILLSIASPLSLVDPTQSLVLPPGIINSSVSTSPSLGKGWPGKSFKVHIETVGGLHDHCYLWFQKVGERRGTSIESQFFLLNVLEEMVKLRAQPPGSPPKAFDFSRYDVRFQMEPIPQHSMSTDMAYAALAIVYNIVKDGEFREFVALLVCRGVALGRFRSWFWDAAERKARSLP